MEMSQELAKIFSLLDPEEELVMHLDSAGHLEAYVEGWDADLSGEIDSYLTAEERSSAVYNQIKECVEELNKCILMNI